jgi:hypothetical protein
MRPIRVRLGIVVLTAVSLLASGCQIPMAQRSAAPGRDFREDGPNYGIRNPWVIGGITAAALAVPLALDDDD